MQRVLFHSTIFGPIHSRRLGVSLGVNLSPNDGKTCSFDCLYCEAGYNAQGAGTTGLPTRARVAEQLEAKLKAMHQAGEPLDVITFSGNGEPTLHPDFEGIVDDTLRLRDAYYPAAHVSVLTNSTRVDRPEVCRALRRVDNNIVKLDSAIPATVKLLDRPNQPSFSPEWLIPRLEPFAGTCIVQTMLTRGTDPDGNAVDNTTPVEIDALIEAYRRIRPRQIMLYSLDRKTPCATLQKVPLDELQTIGERIAAATSIPVQVN